MALTKIAEDGSTITLGWSPVPGVAGYRGTREGYVKPDGSQKWSQTQATQMRFAKADWYRVEALKTLDFGVYPRQEVFPSPARYPSEVM